MDIDESSSNKRKQELSMLFTGATRYAGGYKIHHYSLRRRFWNDLDLLLIETSHEWQGNWETELHPNSGCAIIDCNLLRHSDIYY